METRARALRFAQLAGLELKGKITARGFTAKTVAHSTGHSASALNRWLNGHVELPMTVLCEACETIGIEPRDIIDVAYDRLLTEHGEPEHGAPDAEGLALAAKKGRRKADVDHAE